MLQREPDVVQPIQQAMAHEFIDGELRAESLIVGDFAFLEVNRDPIVGDLLRPLHQLRGLILGEAHSEKPILCAVVGKDIREGRRDDRPEAKIGQRPYRVFARRSTTKVPPRDQDARAFVARLIEHEIGILLSVHAKPPVVKKKLSEASFLDALQELLGNDLVRIHIDPIQRRYATAMHCEWFHRASSLDPVTKGPVSVGY